MVWCTEEEKHNYKPLAISWRPHNENVSQDNVEQAQGSISFESYF